MNIVYSSSNEFSGIFAVSVTSLFETNKESDLRVFLIDENICKTNKEKIRSIGRRYGKEIIIIPMISIEQLATVHIDVPAGCSLSTYGRLFLPTMLPDDIDKALYIDCDTIIRKPLDELWNTDISGYMAAMVDDGHSMAYRKVLGLKTTGRYFSAGIMLINLKEWRERQIERDFIRYIQSQNGYVPIGDQGVLNAVCDGEIRLLPLRYNVYTAVIAFSYQEFLKLRSLSVFYGEDEYNQANIDPTIVHFMYNFYMPMRPWQEGCVHPYASMFLNSRALTEWKDEPLQKDKRSIVKKAYTSFCHIIPRRGTVWISSLIHEYFISLTHKCKKAKHGVMNHICKCQSNDRE